MKLSEISRYWAAKELTKITVETNGLKLFAPFAAPDFTIKLDRKTIKKTAANGIPLTPVSTIKELKAGTFFSSESETLICFYLKKGNNQITL